MKPEFPTTEVQRLQLCINDLVSVLALPAMWASSEPSEIVRRLLDSLLEMLRLDLVYLRLHEPIGDAPMESVRTVAWSGVPAAPEEVGALLQPWLTADPHAWPPRIEIGTGQLSVVPLRLGLQGEIGLLAVGTCRHDFPQQTERLVLSVAANQATIGLQAVRHLIDHKRLTAELERRVAERTAELSTLNGELRRHISERRWTEAALRASELDLQRMTETIPQMLWSATADGAIDYCNDRLVDFTGFTAADIMGDGWKKLLHPDDVEQTARTWEASVATGVPFHVEARLIHPADRIYRWCVTDALPLQDESGRIVKWYGACVDMHDWKEAQDELRDTQAELAHMTRVMTMGHLTASIAHELNQPLAGIITNASTCLRMLAAEPANVSGARETARRTIRDGNRAAEVISRLRALFSKRSTAVETVDLNTAIQEVIALTATELQRNGVSLRLELADDLPFVKGDRVQLQQVIMNLVLNAVEAMDGVADRLKELTVATEQDGTDRVRVVVRDVGVGIDAAAAAKLFNPFYTTKGHGMGIGLSVSRSIVEHHQGRLWAEANDGPGATFLISIPTRPHGEAPMEPSVAQPVGQI